MRLRALDTWKLAQLWPVVMSLLILASMSASLLVLSPWEFDLITTGLTHFLTMWPLFLLAVITYVTRVKLGDEELEVPHS